MPPGHFRAEAGHQLLRNRETSLSASVARVEWKHADPGAWTQCYIAIG